MCCCLSSAAVSGFHRLSRRETDLARPPGWGAAASSGGSCHGPAQGLSSEAERREEREPLAGGSDSVSVASPLSEVAPLPGSRGRKQLACMRDGLAARPASPERGSGNFVFPGPAPPREFCIRRAVKKKGFAPGLHKTSRPGPLRPRLGGTGACVPVPLDGLVTWLILPVVICLSQRLSHACLSINDSVP